MESYKLSIKGTDSTSPITKCGADPTKTTCKLSMQELQEEPYNLKIGDKIQVKVTAFNSEGPSQESAKYVPVPRVRGIPMKLNKPELVKETSNELTVKWEESEAKYDDSLVYRFDDNGQE